MGPTSTSTSQRSSLGRPPPHPAPTLNTKSTPNLNVKYSSPQRPPIPPIPAAHLSNQPTDSNTGSPRRKSLGTPSRYSRSALPNEGQTDISPPSMYAPKPITTSRSANDDRNGNQNLEVGDVVDVPGGMHGIIRFIGEVKGKKGVFAGVELSKEWAARGKNDGDVEGVRYFSTSIKGAGIFLPSNKAYKRLSPPLSQGSNPETPTTPSLAPFNQGGRADPKINATTTPSLNAKFSQSVGPARSGARSPELKQKSRPSLPRPESPTRKTQNSISTPSNRPSLGNPKLSKSVVGASRYAPSPTPGRFGASVTGASKSQIGDPGKKLPITPKSSLKKGPNGIASTPNDYRSESRSDSRLGPEPMFDSESDNTPIGGAKSALSSRNTQGYSRPVSTHDDEIRLLRSQLADRDKQLEKQAADIEEMQHSVNELQSTTPIHASSSATRSSRNSALEDLDAASLRALVREKNEKIKQLTDEFDSHRADFRDTIDILEHTSDETNRLHQEKIENLQADLREMQERMDRGEDMDTVAQTLKQLDEQVQELEEGLEDARRGEAEARGEVEFLRGEVERSKAELDREKQKNATSRNVQAGNDVTSGTNDLIREVKRRDDEIKGLRAIIHSLNQTEAADRGSPRSSHRGSKLRNSGHGQINGHDAETQLAEERQAREKLEKEVKELENTVDRKTYREEELEHEIERLRKVTAHFSAGSNGLSEHTARPSSKHKANASSNPSIDWEERGSPTSKFNGPGAIRSNIAGISRQRVDTPLESDSHSTTMTESSNLFCDLCDTAGHDILSCTNVGGPSGHAKQGSRGSNTRSAEYTSPRLQSHDREEDYSLDQDLGNENPRSPVQHHQSPTSPSRQFAPTVMSTIPENPSLNATPRPPSQPAPAPQQQPRMPMPNPMDTSLMAGKTSGIADANKWCAICERDGHDATDCPLEGQF